VKRKLTLVARATLTLTSAAAVLSAGCAGSKPKSGDTPPAAGAEPGSGSASSSEPSSGGGAGGKATPGIPTAPPVDPTAQEFQTSVNAIEKSGSEPKWDDAADKMKDFTKDHPRYAPAFYNLGVAYEKTGKDEDAENAYRQAVGLDGNLREAQENLAALLARKGDTRQAASMLRSLVDRDPGAAGARVTLAETVLNQGGFEEASTLAREALSREPKNLSAYCVLARAAEAQKDAQMARLLVSQGLKIQDAAGCLHFVLGLVLYREKQLGQALEEFERAVDNQPELIEARFRIAQISMALKDFKKAIASYEAVVKVDPKNAAAWVNMGVAYKGSARFDEAEKAYLKAIEIAGNDAPIPEAHFDLGVLYLRNLSKSEEAKAQLKRYLQLGSTQTNDPAFAMLDEIEQLKAMVEAQKQAEEEEKRQAAIEKKAAEEKAKKDAEDAQQKKEEDERQKKIEEKVAAEKAASDKGADKNDKKGADKNDKKGEPADASPTPDVPPSK
jgi:tetratricopeptide (TPR) repeat protein